ncbi:MAG: hypothetical protein M1817_001638 [Caeruleum heppii]|nr:MAG: hypothetical protein M1817_001638 [Caeruleum heppii]
MSSPSPPVPLRASCSVIYRDTLYVYSPDAFQSIELKEGAEWKTLPLHVAVTGAICVKSAAEGEDDRAALYLIGGSTNASTIYPGFSRFTFSEEKWDMVSPEVPVTQNRRRHGAAFLKASSSILVYAGSQDSSLTGPSSQTFIVSIEEPFRVLSFESRAPPVVSPMVMPWNDSHAVMVGGDPNNKRAFTFSPQDGWSDLGVSLDFEIPERSKAGSAIIDGDDGSKVMETFDLSVSPNMVRRTVLAGARGGSRRLGRSISRHRRRAEAPPAKRQKRELTLNDWPTYNASLAPTTTRSDFSIANDQNGRIVIAGGNEEEPLSIFNARENSWANVKELFNGQEPLSESTPTPSPSVTSASAAPTSTPPTSAAPATAPPDRGRDRALTVLGATLGAIFGVALLLILALLFLKWRRRKRRHDEAGHQRRASGLTGEKDRMSFADRGASFMSEAGGFVNRGFGHKHQDSTASATSMTIIAGTAGGQKKGLFPKRTSKDIGKSPLGASRVPREPRGIEDPGVSFALTPASPASPPRAGMAPGRQRSSGWSRYFSGNSATNLVHMNSARSGHTARTVSDDDLNPNSTALGPRGSASASVQPLNYGRSSSGQELDRVAAATSTLRQVAADAPGASKPGGLERGQSSSTGTSATTPDEFSSSGLTASVNEETQWTPVARTDWAGNRVPSSVYTASPRGSSTLPGAAGGRQTSTGSLAFPRNSSATASFMPRERDRESNVTTFPRGGPGAGEYERDLVAPTTSSTAAGAAGAAGGTREQTDMSWLNLGGNRNS